MKSVRAWCVAVLFAAAGCGGGGGGGGSSTAADFCMQYATKMCGVANACVVTSSTCVSYQLQKCTAFANAATAGGKRLYTPGNAGNCLNKIQAAYDGKTVITPATLAAIDLACNYVFQGKAALLKDPCTTQYDCAGATDGSIVCDPTAKLCAMKMTVASGAQCSPVGAVCAQDTFCAANPANVSLCMPTSKTGESCASIPCDHTSRCVNGVCAALAQQGEACRADADCAASAPYCNPYVSPSVCTPGLQFAVGSPSCSCVTQGTSCPTGTTGAAGSSGGGAGGHATGTAGAGGTGTAGAAGGGGTAGAAGAAGTAGAAGSAGTPGTAGAAGGAGAGGQGGEGLLGLGGLGV